MNKTPSSPSASPTTQPNMTPGSAIQRKLTGMAELPDYTKVPSKLQIWYDNGEQVSLTQALSRVEEWIRNQNELLELEDVKQKETIRKALTETIKMKNK